MIADNTVRNRGRRAPQRDTQALGKPRQRRARPRSADKTLIPAAIVPQRLTAGSECDEVDAVLH